MAAQTRWTAARKLRAGCTGDPIGVHLTAARACEFDGADGSVGADQGLLPGRVGTEGRPAQDNRLFVEAVLYRYRAGIPWRDLLERFGDCRVERTRFTRWAARGVWKQVLEHLRQDADNQ